MMKLGSPLQDEQELQAQVRGANVVTPGAHATDFPEISRQPKTQGRVSKELFFVRETICTE